MIEITLPEPDNFLKVKETLTRMGIANQKDKILYQSCHILQKNGKYYIVHFKEMMGFDGKPVYLTEEDILRTSSIAKMLESWNMIKTNLGDIEVANNFRIIKHSQKDDWKLVSKYKIGN